MNLRTQNPQPMRLPSLALTAALLLTVGSIPSAQHQLQPVAALRGAPALELALRKLETVGTFI